MTIVARISSAAPNVLALVTLREGPTMMTNILDCDVETMGIGMSVAVIFEDDGEGCPMPKFKP